MTRARYRQEYIPRKTTFQFAFTAISMSKKLGFFRTRAERGNIAWHIDTSSVVWTLIYHGKLANQIARLPAIVVKSMIRRTQHKPGEGGTGQHFKEKDWDLLPKLRTQTWQNCRCKQRKLPQTKAKCVEKCEVIWENWSIPVKGTSRKKKNNVLWHMAVTEIF